MTYTTLYRPVGPDELVLIEQSGWKRFPPRRPDQPIFYPVMNEAYAIQITTEWNVPAYGSGFVTRFAVASAFLEKYTVENVGSDLHNELWIPAEDLDAFNGHIIGLIEVTQSYHREPA
ncbi:ADP-ribosylation/crystallin J1 [Chitinophaga nivalis]|uniref:ADP-ribosylation/crystallin J1 n=1 Tax=Chitinophaga nivalis TaxID=2991709 RepID=A0ABT3IHC6_9BACT|nr:ADP-ribosylation/crystallin J1 [Chitinophaga nivalis]MCW3466945.1 ADP-ribosylation/crystallin J1 [Chitinophaga nivalis]MCW3483364.1 ADP-ribosylation/crystallin J1 [Chitinophaga nivalis]